MAKSYGDRLIASIALQCARRGIPPEEFQAVGDALDENFGKLTKKDDRQLRRVSEGLDGFFRKYLDGEKRRAPKERETETITAADVATLEIGADGSVEIK